MQIIQRIIGKIVGKELSSEDLKKIAGGESGDCECQTVYSDGTPTKCDNC